MADQTMSFRNSMTQTKSVFTSRDYKLLKEVMKIRIHCAYNRFQEWVYETDVYRNALTKFARRMLNDHNRLAKLFRMVETIRIEICKDR